MSNNNAKAILQAVKTTLTASPSLVNSTTLKEVVIGRTTDHSQGCPFVRVYLEDWDGPIADTVSYERRYGVAVEIWQEITAKTKEDAELDLANALHTVLDRLGGTWQLGISVELSEIAPGQIRLAELNAGPALLAPIRLNVTTLIQNPS